MKLLELKLLFAIAKELSLVLVVKLVWVNKIIIIVRLKSPLAITIFDFFFAFDVERVIVTQL